MRCFIDLDGVLTDFEGGACRVFGVDPAELRKRWGPGDWNINNGFGVTEDELWLRIDRHGAGFWFGLERLPDALFILALAEKTFGQSNVAILTSPPRNPDAVAGKVSWIREFLPAYRRQFFVGPKKEFMAHPGAVLIDDSGDNVRKFRQAGGHAVLVPRWANELHGFDPLSYLTIELKGFRS